jgi:hypothetical protein
MCKWGNFREEKLWGWDENKERNAPCCRQGMSWLHDNTETAKACYQNKRQMIFAWYQPTHTGTVPAVEPGLGWIMGYMEHVARS